MLPLFGDGNQIGTLVVLDGGVESSPQFARQLGVRCRQPAIGVGNQRAEYRIRLLVFVNDLAPFIEEDHA